MKNIGLSKDTGFLHKSIILKPYSLMFEWHSYGHNIKNKYVKKKIEKYT